MKFLLEFVPCFGYQQQQLQRSTSSSAADEPPRTDEKRSQQPSRRRRKRGRVAGVVEWRPSLSAISEDMPAMTVKVAKGGTELRPATEAGERQVRRKSGGGSSRSGGICMRSRGDDFGRNGFETAIPAFTPTPFMF